MLQWVDAATGHRKVARVAAAENNKGNQRADSTSVVGGGEGSVFVTHTGAVVLNADWTALPDNSRSALSTGNRKFYVYRVSISGAGQCGTPTAVANCVAPCAGTTVADTLWGPKVA